MTGLRCPLTWVRTKLALDGLEVGEALQVTLPPGEAVEEVPRSAREAGHAVAMDGSVATIVKAG